MYCKHCGKEIDDNSIYCKHCGKSQSYTQNGLAIKPVWIFYLIWTLANLYLLTGEKARFEESLWYPFISKQCYYGFYEFIIYVFILPAILYVVYRRYNEKINKFVDKLLNKK